MKHLQIMPKIGLYDPSFEHDSCGIGLVANIKGYKSHQIIQEGINIIKNLVHRGAIGGDLKTGDGAGILFQLPYQYFVKVMQEKNIILPGEGEFGVGMLFLPQDETKRKQVEEIISKTVYQENGKIIGWRDVPVNPDCLGEMAYKSMPVIKQVFIEFAGYKDETLERKLYVIRKIIENKAFIEGITIEEFYIVSLSSRTIIYKGMFVGNQLDEFYQELKDSDIQSSFILVHQRYSTNTFPSWPLSQPFRYIAHNGEINTLRGNINKMRAREPMLSSPLFGNKINDLIPIITPGLSDSGTFDNVCELLVQSGRSIEHTLMMMIPEPFGNKYYISLDKRAFYEYHSAIMEPWDGPAAIVFTDGFKVGAILDRNGLRPARYVITKSDKLILASEFGVLDIPASEVLERGRLAPGKMILVDTKNKKLYYDHEIKASISRQKPYRKWLENNRIELKEYNKIDIDEVIEKDEVYLKQLIFGYSLEDINKIIIPMVETAQEPVSSMGNDEALAIFSKKPKLLYDYFKQLFAQVTNPPIDPYRENMSMSLMSFMGRERNLLDETPEHCKQLKLPHPILTNLDIEKLKVNKNLKCFEISILFGGKENFKSMENALDEICRTISRKIDDGHDIIILTDKNVDEGYYPIPALLAVSAVHQYLIRVGKRQQVGLIIETGEAREIMHFATLIGFGANAINPYLVLDSIVLLAKEGKLKKGLSIDEAIDNYIVSIKKGLLKVMSKLGISTLRSYRGAQTFEAIGLNSNFIEKYFTNTPSRIGGIGIEEIEKETIDRVNNANYKNKIKNIYLDSGGNVHYRYNSEKHILTPEAIVTLQKAVRNDNYDTYKEYSKIIDDNVRNLCTIRGLFKFKNTNPIPIDEVEPVESIVKRFVTSAMSFGSISKEAHETLALAMNRLGASSNSGEGGEEEERFIPLPNGDSLNSKIKQVASGRFGVTSNYIVNSKELQIKIAQGAKPGEGGQLPGDKVYEWIAKVRHSLPGITLISPPPHHDIYSIEDIAQLIYDLKNANPEAIVSVKLVAEIGVGTIAAGVIKGGADKVIISGHDGGTGASPLSSIKHAGIPWEIGLSETQQTLLLNKLRNRAKIQTDGKMKTGRDVVIAALLGADEVGFGTIPLITLGCIMMRKCHLNTCPVGVATQNPELRKRFQGKPEYVMNFMKFVATETREIMASLGFRTFDEMIGKCDLLDIDTSLMDWKSKKLDLSPILVKVESEYEKVPRFVSYIEDDLSKTLDSELIQKSKESIESKKTIKLFTLIRNSDRSVGAMLSSVISKKYGSAGLPDNTIHCKFNGTAGQSFGAFLTKGVTFELEGEANDYVGKGLSGGKIIIYPPKGYNFKTQQNIIAGNVILFGATSGEVYISGVVGERFAVRNSGAIAVVEGVGDHGCEYMTGGLVVVLGKTGVNFAAGMSGGIAYVLDDDQLFDTRCNLEMVDIEPVSDDDEKIRLYNLIKNHVNYTSSEYAERILKEWDYNVMHFVKVMPIEYKKILERMKYEEIKNTETLTVSEEVYK